jgi:WD40 repeat protein
MKIQAFSREGETKMQQRGRAIQRSLWLLISTLLFLGGCVTPDGSVLRSTQAPDGTIIGWKIEQPNGQVTNLGARGQPILPPPPILYVGEEEGFLSLKAVQRTGQSLGSMTGGSLGLLGWSPQGDQYAVTAVISETTYLAVVEGLEEQQVVASIKFAPDERVISSPLQSVWSPNGQLLAVLVESPEFGSYITFLSVERNEIVHSIRLRWPFLGASYVQWSPDGRKLLVGGDKTLIIDLKTGGIRRIVEGRTVAQWLPSSDAIIYFYEPGSAPNEPPRNLFFKELGGQEITLFSQDQLHDWGLDGQSTSLMRLEISPSGAYLAIVDTFLADTVLVFENAGNDPQKWRQPIVTVALEESRILDLAWAPNEQELALVLYLYQEQGGQLALLTLQDGSVRPLIALGDPEDDFDEAYLLTYIRALTAFQMISWAP